MQSRWRLWLPVVVWIGLISFFSTDSFSAGHTAGIIVSVLHYLFPFLSPPELEFWHFVCRKAGHVSEYCVLGFLTWRAMRASLSGSRHALSVAGFVLLIALGDEFHQFFVPSRTSSLVDVGYDFAGGAIALILLQLFYRAPRRLHSHPVL